MRYIKIFCVLVLFAFTPDRVHGVGIPLVYDLRIAETTLQLTSCNESQATSHKVIGTLIRQVRTKRQEGHSQYINGALGSFVYTPSCYYLRVEFGGAHVRDSLFTSCDSKTQSDDVLCLSGYTYTFSNKLKATLSGLCGIPTHQDNSLRETQLGYAHVGLGVQADYAYGYGRNEHQSLQGVLRYVYFLPRMVCDTENRRITYKITELINFLIMNRSSWNQHALNVGYTVVWAIAPMTKPFIESVQISDPYTRSSFFCVYTYAARDTVALVLGTSYALDHEKLMSNNKGIVTLWGSLSMSF